MRVLVVDDEEHLRRVMRLTLEAEGYEVAEAADGEDALRLFGDGSSIDATLLDQKMPGLDGLETLRRIRLRRADACIIMVTAYATIALAVDAMKLGATDFVRKPMTPETLRHAVDAALAKRGTTTVGGTTPIARAPTPPQSPPETWTTNGFFIRRVELTSASEGQGSREHHFMVRRGNDAIGVAVVVSIDPKALASVSREARRDLRASGGFWHGQAERALVNYLWSEAAVPEGGRLVIVKVPGPVLDEAMRWSGD
jgi:DNA-binding response OmpR family regulator